MDLCDNCGEQPGKTVVRSKSGSRYLLCEECEPYRYSICLTLDEMARIEKAARSEAVRRAV